MSQAVHFSSATPEWYTPDEVLKAVLDLFGAIDLDPCSNSHDTPNVPAMRHYTAVDDGLVLPWSGLVFVNPPYGRPIGRWVERTCRAYESREITGAVMLLPARSGTAWFFRLRNYPLLLFSRRLTFKGAENDAPFPSMAAYLGRDVEGFDRAFADFGDVWVRREEGAR